MATLRAPPGVPGPGPTGSRTLAARKLIPAPVSRPCIYLKPLPLAVTLLTQSQASDSGDALATPGPGPLALTLSDMVASERHGRIHAERHGHHRVMIESLPVSH
jgi:hypothetical protein